MNLPRSRLVAVAILIGAVALCWLAIVQPVIDVFASQANTIARSQLTLATYQRRIAMRPAIEALLSEMTAREAMLPNTVGGVSAELAAANVQTMIKAIVDADQVQVSSVQNLPPTTWNGLQRIDIQYDMTVPMVHLKDLIYRMETNVPFLFLSNVDIRAPENWQALNAQADAPNVQIRWVVRSYRRLGAP